MAGSTQENPVSRLTVKLDRTTFTHADRVTGAVAVKSHHVPGQTLRACTEIPSGLRTGQGL